MFVPCRFIARLEEQIHEWKLNTVTLGTPLTKVVAICYVEFAVVIFVALDTEMHVLKCVYYACLYM